MKKKICTVVLLSGMMFFSGNALACGGLCCGGNCTNNHNTNFVQSTAINSQGQTQGSFNHGVVSGIHQEQAGFGGSEAGFGGSANESQEQGEHINFHTRNTGFDSVSNTWGGSNVSETAVGHASHIEGQTIRNTAATYSNNHGTLSTAGSTMGVNQHVGADVHMCTHRCGESTAGAEAGTYTSNISGYVNNNVGRTSNISQFGEQQNEFTTHAIVTNHGYANGSLSARQSGGTIATNNSRGTEMAGGGIATGHISTRTNTGCNGVVTAEGSQHQIHGYTQQAGNSTQGQWASGIVETSQNTNSTCTHVGCR